MNILVLDNYDSFTYNLVHMVEKITDKKPDVYRNDKITVKQAQTYDLIILSPGPGIPEEAGILKELIKTCAGKLPIFGVCLGLQAITEVFGGTIQNMDEVYHGVATTVKIIQKDALIFKGVPNLFQAAQYHSWKASKKNFPKTLEITATDQRGIIMALRHKTYPLSAVQFHPESILTQVGQQIVKNFITGFCKKIVA
ncbi:MAG: anthranilate synthase component II [Tenacibaculum sp.]